MILIVSCEVILYLNQYRCINGLPIKTHQVVTLQLKGLINKRTNKTAMKNLIPRSLYTSVLVFCLSACSIQSEKVEPKEYYLNKGARKASGDLYCTQVSIDWYSVACSQGGDVCYWSYMYTETSSECTYRSQRPITTASGGIWLDSYLVPASTQRLLDITLSSTLTPNQTKQLEEEVNDFIAYCLQNIVFS